MTMSRVVILPLLVLINVTSLLLVDASTVVANSPFGKIQGVEKTDKDTGLSYVSFKGIPYAKPPVGDLRFAKPQPHPKIDGVFDATKDDQIHCPHPELMTFGLKGFTEDCLVLNIQVKDLSPSGNSLKKVLVFIHGGGFIVGSSYFYDAKSFVNSQDVIVVTINYRLGVLGFLSTENDASPGNYGLWDQTLALKWVKDNIRDFGGDPDDVTIAGESAGGASVGYQIISPHAKGLFSKAYPQSGTATSVFAHSIKAQAHALAVAKSAGCWDKDVGSDLSINESNTIVNCLRKVPVSAIVAFNKYSISTTQFVPRVDGDFVPDIPANLLNDDTYLDSIGFFERSYLIAVNNNEVAIMDNFAQTAKFIIYNDTDTSAEEKESAWQDLLTASKDLYMLSRLGERGASDGETVNTIEDFYNRRLLNYSAFIEMVSDLSFLVPSLDYLSAAARRKSCNSYFLYFNHFPQYMRGSRKGTPHAVDLLYWFDIDIKDIEKLLQVGIDGEITEDDVKLKTLFSSIVGDFIRSGNPGLALKNIIPSGWPKYDVSKSHYLNFNPNPWVSSFLEKDKQDLWFKTVPRLLKQQHRHSEL